MSACVSIDICCNDNVVLLGGEKSAGMKISLLTPSEMHVSCSSRPCSFNVLSSPQPAWRVLGTRVDSGFTITIGHFFPVDCFWTILSFHWVPSKDAASTGTEVRHHHLAPPARRGKRNIHPAAMLRQHVSGGVGGKECRGWVSGTLWMGWCRGGGSEPASSSGGGGDEVGPRSRDDESVRG